MATTPGFPHSARPTGGRQKPRTTVMSTRRNLVTGITAAALALVLANGAALTAAAGDQPAGRHARFADQHGPVLPAPQLYLIYWGTAWMPQTAPAPTAAEVTGAVRTLLASGYLTG